MKKLRVMFMHTIDGHAARYEPGRQIVFAAQGQYARRPITLVPTLAQIKKEQIASARWRTSQGFDAHDANYSYARVEVPS